MRQLHTAASTSSIVTARLKSADILVQTCWRRDPSKMVVLRHEANFCGAQDSFFRRFANSRVALKAQLKSKLDLALRSSLVFVGSTRDLSHSRICNQARRRVELANHVGGQSKIRMVGQIEKLSSELEPKWFPNAKVLKDPEVEVSQRGSNQKECRDVAAASMASEASTPHSPPMPMPNSVRSTRKNV